MRPELTARLLLAALALSALPAGTAHAQVGHDPARSPYRTLRFGQFLGLTGGLLNGNGGALGVAPHHGASLGVRYEFLSAGTVTFGFAASVADLERLVVDPKKPIETAVSGPVKQRVEIAEGIVQFNVTGGKTWHRIAPFISAGAGIMLSKDTPLDTSGFTFHTRFALTPGLGARIFLADRLFLRVEARTSFWSVSYPDSYRQVPSTDSSKPAVLASPKKEWLANGWYTVGLSYAFSRPF
jgi:opacity protein-like surface antigen